MTESTARGLVYEGRLPLVWSERGAAPSESELAHTESANLDILRTLLILETQTGNPSEDAQELESETIARLDFKLNLLLELVGQLFAQHQLIPNAHPLTLTTAALRWQDIVSPSIDSLVRIDLYCSMKYPHPVVLHGRVEERIAEAAGWTIGAALYGMGETVQEELERFIFVHHRRAVAQSRRRRAPPEQC